MRKEQAFDSRRKILQEKTRRSTSFYFGSLKLISYFSLHYHGCWILFWIFLEVGSKKNFTFIISAYQEDSNKFGIRHLVQTFSALDSCSCSTLKIFFYLWSKLCCKSDITCLAQRFSTVGHILHGKVIFAVWFWDFLILKHFHEDLRLRLLSLWWNLLRRIGSCLLQKFSSSGNISLEKLRVQYHLKDFLLKILFTLRTAVTLCFWDFLFTMQFTLQDNLFTVSLRDILNFDILIPKSCIFSTVLIGMQLFHTFLSELHPHHCSDSFYLVMNSILPEQQSGYS